MSGCPICDWDGEIAVTNDGKKVYYTHVKIEAGTMIQGTSCSRKIERKRGNF